MAKLKELVDSGNSDIKKNKGLLSKATRCDSVFDSVQLRKLQEDSKKAYQTMENNILVFYV